jgi:hypothetical protein
MRLAFAASALCLSALGLSLLTQADQPATTPPAATTPATPAATPATMAPSPAPVASDAAAAKHVKRTACLKEAKAKKLIGAEKTAFLKSCIEAPQEPISASRQVPPERP